MYKLVDKNDFYQWDLERKLEIIDELVTEVHFKKYTGNELLVCEVYTDDDIRIVDVPNILFTTTEKFIAYFYCNDLYTKQHANFEIVPRPKPTDYVYTETEVKRYDTLEDKIEELEIKIDNIPKCEVDQEYNSESENAQSGKAVKQAITEMVDTAPETLDTLNELANALGNDPNFATTVMTEIGKKANKDEVIGKKTEQGGVIIGDDDDNNKALAKDTFVNGNDNWAGYYGYKINYIAVSPGNDEIEIWLDDENLTTKVKDAYAINDVVQMHLQRHYHDRYYISEIIDGRIPNNKAAIILKPTYGDIITDSFTLVPAENDPEGLRNWLYVIGKPYGEPMKYSKGATAFGGHNIVTGQGALGIGVENEVLGHGALAAGSGNRVGYAAFSNGTENEAMHNRSATLGRGLRTGRVNQTVVGEFNEIEENAMFVVGGGTGKTPSTNKTLFKVEDNGDAYLKGDLIARDKNLATEINELGYQIDSPDKYKIVNNLPLPISAINPGSMYLINTQTGYDKYIFNNTGNKKNTEASSIWNGTTVAPTINEEGVYIIDSAEKLAYIIANGGTMIENDVPVTNCVFVLTKDIYLNDITKYNWLSGTAGSGLRSWYTTTTSFNGTIEGNFHTIYGLYSWYKYGSYPSNTTTVGLIPTVGQQNTATINNLIIDYCAIRGKANAAAFVGNNYGGTVNINSCVLGKNVFISGYRATAFISGGYQGAIDTITNSASYATISLSPFSEGKDDGSSVVGFISHYFLTKATVSNSFNANGPICSNYHTELRIYDCFETVQGSENNNVTVLTPEQMQGKNVLDKDGPMNTLNSNGIYWVATDTYPIHMLLSFDWIKIDDDCDKIYVDKKATETEYSTHLKLVEVDKRLTKTDEELERRIYQNTNDIASLQAKVEIPQLELILRDENNNKYRIFIKDGKLQLEVVE